MSSFPDISVTVQVQHVPSHSTPQRQLFAYFITIDNHSDESWKLLSRHWDITSGDGQQFTVEGEGVVGEQPHIPPGGSYTYDSFVTVEAAPARMSGYYLLQDAWGAQAQVPIPAFILDVPGTRVLN